jgi:hypothetical protein
VRATEHSSDRKPGMKSRTYLALLCPISLILFACLLLNPASIPTPVRGLDVWARAHWTTFIWIMAGICIADFVLGFDKFQQGTNKKLEALEKQVAELKSSLRDLNRKT